MPIGTPAAEENNSGLYLKCECFSDLFRADGCSSEESCVVEICALERGASLGNGIFSFADH